MNIYNHIGANNELNEGSQDISTSNSSGSYGFQGSKWNLSTPKNQMVNFENFYPLKNELINNSSPLKTENICKKEMNPISFNKSSKFINRAWNISSRNKCI